MDGPWIKASGVAFDVIVTLADHVAFDRHTTRTPAFRRRLGRFAFAGCIVTPVLAFVIVLIAKGALAGSGCDLDDALESTGRLRVFLQAGGGVGIVGVLAAAAILALRGRVYEATARVRLERRPGVDPRDPLLSEPCRCAFDAQGFRAETPSLSVGATWALVKSFEETADHMFVLIGTFQGFIVPKRDVPPATVLAVRDLARAHVRAS